MLETQIGDYRKALVDLEEIKLDIAADLKCAVLEELMPEVIKEVKRIPNHNYTPEEQVNVLINKSNIDV